MSRIEESAESTLRRAVEDERQQLILVIARLLG